jgi:hypothetical protein
MSSLRVAQILGVCELTMFEEIWGLGNACLGLIVQMHGGFEENI